MGSLEVDVRDATDRQLLVHLLTRFNLLETRMSELSAAVTDLQSAVDGVASRLLPQLERATAAIDTLRTQLADALADDEAAAAALEEAEQAAAAIREQVNELNSLGASPEEPVAPE